MAEHSAKAMRDLVLTKFTLKSGRTENYKIHQISAAEHRTQ